MPWRCLARSWLLRASTLAGSFSLGAACGGPDAADGECVEVWDLGDACNLWNKWCGGDDAVPPSHGDTCGFPLTTCFEPSESGECVVCSAEEVEAKVRAEVQADADKFGYVVEHWEFGRTQDVERAKANGADEDYCCFRSIAWYEGRDACVPPRG